MLGQRMPSLPACRPERRDAALLQSLQLSLWQEKLEEAAMQLENLHWQNQKLDGG